ncbi:Bacterial alpha-L-rhamnosidase [Microbacterium hydrocarbonoxydans]|uniref:alpha-L-rhamnosidase n=1 Tax=Microbacterium hydrocarbonoxydans TaxID=273678 RepID=A0A0M2HQU7_9MICO|nr:alpha-L-rhamnosidase [Microbacterium hydrocarbonoxydans]KJL47290.1 Bacterial alpha-L-rhamnosidase [Microbacterium hydrocarbonoxydans]
MSDPKMIAPQHPADAAPLLRREFALAAGHGAVRRATLRLSALGVVEAWVNGIRSSDELLAPGWTSYEWRVRLIEHDVTHAVAERTTIGLRIGNGWYRGFLGFTGRRAVYGAERAALAELEVVFADGFVQRVVTDGSWRAGTGEVRADDLYNGQTIDARFRDQAWSRPGFDDSDWDGVAVVEFDTAMLVARTSPPVRVVGERAVERVWTSPSGRTLIDFGQNLVGVIRARVSGPDGTEIVLRHAEVLEDGELGVRPLRAAQATDRFILSGGDDVFEPTLTFHGFRYAEVSGWPGELDPAALTAVVVATDIPVIGTFACSDPDLVQLHRNVEWGMRGNFLSVPTDCPQRDERLGWTGDLAVFAPTAAFLGDVESFLADWLVDAELERRATPEQTVPVVVPNVMKHLDTGFPEPGATAIWGDAAVWVPWALWRAYGREQTLRDAYPLMTAHVRSVAAVLSPSGLWDQGFQFGDWLDPDAPADDPGKAKTPAEVVATASAFRTASMMVDAARVLDRPDDEAEFAALRDRIGAAFREHYVDDGRVRGDSETGYALAIAFELVEGEDRRRAGERLAELVRASGHAIRTGFAGTPFILDALTSTGHLDDAYGLLLRREMPSWLYPVTMGATTIWERWDSMLPDGSINPGEMTSFNHYAFGAVADWMHRTIGGLAPLEAGYRRFLVSPQPGGGITWAETTLDTPHGRAAVRWSTTGETLQVQITVPDGTEAVLRLPGRADEVVGAGIHHLEAEGAER